MRSYRLVWASLLLVMPLSGPPVARAASLATASSAGPLRAEWSVERTPAGRARITGYVYNDNIVRNAANVWLRVEEVTASGAVARVYRGRIAGDVLSRGRLAFDVPVADAGDATTYRVIVDSVDWFEDCR